MYRLLFVAMSLVALSGCASIAGEKTQPITFRTVVDNTEVAGVGCSLSNDAGSWFVTTPGSVTVHKSTGDLAVDCKKSDLSGHQTLISKSNGAVWGNIIAGGGIGYIVDRNTGAGFNYPDSVTVQLHKISEAGSDAPKDSPPVSSANVSKNDSNSGASKPAVSSNHVASAQDQQNDIASKLAELRSLRDKNLITQQEYDDKKKTLLSKL